MINAETRTQIRQWFFAEHWRIGTIAQELGVHPDTVRHAIESDRFHRAQTLRPCLTDPYLPFLRQTLDQHPRLRATRIYQMIRERGYDGSVVQLRRAVATLRPARPEPFLRLHTFPAEQAQVDRKPLHRDGDGNHVHNEILLNLPSKEREMLFPKLEFVRLQTHHVLHEPGDTLKSMARSVLSGPAASGQPIAALGKSRSTIEPVIGAPSSVCHCYNGCRHSVAMWLTRRRTFGARFSASHIAGFS